MPNFLSGRTALVTGADGGIGGAVAEGFRKGKAAHVIVTSEKTEELARRLVIPVGTHDAVAEQIIGQNTKINALLDHDNVHFLTADLLEDEAHQSLIHRAEKIAPVSVLVNNAGTYIAESCRKATKRARTIQFQVNLFARMDLFQLFAERCIERGEPGVHQVTGSINGFLGEPDHLYYDATEAANVAMVYSQGTEYAPYQIYTLMLAPGLVESRLTDFGLRSSPEQRAALEKLLPKGMIDTPEMVAEHYVAYASSLGMMKDVNATTIHLCGGIIRNQLGSRPQGDAEGA